MDLNTKIRVAGIANDSIVDGPGLRMTLFVQGCPHACEGCHNPHTWDFMGGYFMTLGEIIKAAMHNPLLDGITFSGGEPFCKAKELAFIGEALKKHRLNIVTYTGYTFEYLLSHANDENGYRALLAVTDILVDGPFILAKKNLELPFRGSENQRIIDCQRSLTEGTAVLCDNI